jgi:hypothetical protein
MLITPKRPEIDEHTIKLIVGVIAIMLAYLTSLFSETPLQSISASYHENGWSRDIFVGCLFAIFAFLLSYNGKPPYQFFQIVLSKMAAFAALGVAMFPCKCGNNVEVIPYAHYISAAVMFIILAIFCYFFFQRAWGKGYSHAKFRACIYAVCGIIIVSSILILAIDHFSGDIISTKISRLTFYSERAGLVAFGIAWLSASRVLPLLTNKDDRFSLFRDNTKKIITNGK